MDFRGKLYIISSVACIILIISAYLENQYSSPLTHSILIILSFVIFVAGVDLFLLKSVYPMQKTTNQPVREAARGKEIAKVEAKKNTRENARKGAKVDANTVEHKENIEALKSTAAQSLADATENLDNLENFKILHGQYDQLTALPTYTFCLQILSKSIVQAKRHRKIFAVLLVNLDDFQKINFSMGRNVGHQVLKQIGNRISNTLRAEDTIARYTNDQFIILLPDIDKPKFASSAAIKLLEAISQPLRADTSEELIKTTASIGVCIYPNDGDDLEKLLSNAEAALQKAKESGGNTYEFNSKELHSEAREFIYLGKGLRNALKKNEMTIYYQPKLHIKHGQIIGVEALLRWQHPEHGILSPARFLSIAEDTGFISELGEWALREACKANKHWQDEGYTHITVALNLSPKQFYQSDIDQRITKILEETQLNPKYLELEINEATAMTNIDLAIRQMNKLKNIGIQISIDHFGVGYTAISYLKLFPINAIKIDRSFIKGVPNQPNDCAITNAFIALAHQLGYEVIAEGVETAEQLEYLTEHDCDMIQGYYLGHPVSGQKIITQLPKLPDEVLG